VKARSRLVAFVLAFAVVLPLATTACRAGARAEAERLAASVDRFRRAENVDKPTSLESLRAVPCSASDVCRARDACLASAEATVKALRLKQDVEDGLGLVERGELPRESLEAQALPEKLDEAEALLKEGFSLLPACDDKMIALRRTYRL
jgi:hypothetical protein